MEARNIEDFYANFQDDPTVKIPAVYRAFSGKEVLVMEWIDGIRCTDPQVRPGSPQTTGTLQQLCSVAQQVSRCSCYASSSASKSSSCEPARRLMRKETRAQTMLVSVASWFGGREFRVCGMRPKSAAHGGCACRPSRLRASTWSRSSRWA